MYPNLYGPGQKGQGSLIERNNLVTKRNALNGVASFTYDSAGRPLTGTDPLGRTVTYEYDGLDRRNSSESRSEGIAYITNHMLGRGTYNLRTFEDELNSGKFFDNASSQELSPEAYAQQRWGAVCGSFEIYGSGGVFFGGGMRKLDAQDFADAEALLKLKFRLSQLKPIYEQLLKDKGVDASLAIPKSVPGHLR